MIKEIVGDIFRANTNIICHQVNCQGVMGAGIAKTVKEKVGVQFSIYQDLCKKHGAKMLGKVLYLKSGDQLIANCFAQDEYGRSKQYTDYNALRNCMEKVHEEAKSTKNTVAIPGLIGCGLAGGNWDYVKAHIIAPIFQNSDVELTIFYYTLELFQKYAGFTTTTIQISEEIKIKSR